ncbi:MAG: hypothetical protein ACE5G0_03715 [Rhodothermales bacterium]
MPRLSTWLVRFALGYLVLGFTLGGLLLAHKGVGLHPALWAWRPVHVEFLLVGWMLQFVFGVGSWILPRTAARQSPRPILVAFILVNAGVWMVSAGFLQPEMAWLILPGRLSEMGAVVAFAYHIWPRVRPFIQHRHPSPPGEPVDQP